MNPHSEFGVHAMDGNTVSDRVRDYLRAANVELADGTPPPYWGGAFLAWLAHRHGITPPVNAIDPEAWRSFGHPLTHPEPGAVVVLTAGVGRGARVGIISREHAGKLYVTGGDMNGSVGTECYDVGRVMEYRKSPQPLLVPQGGTASQEVRITLSHENLPAALPAPAIDIPAGNTDQLVDMLRQMAQRMALLEQKHTALANQFAGHEHQFQRADGTPISVEDFVLRSEIKQIAQG